MKTILSMFVAAIFLTGFSAEAGDKKKTYTIKWKERDNRIIYSTVCFNYKYGSIDARECRSSALAHFKKQCSDLTEKSNAYGHPHNKDIRQERNKFCVAKNSFSPIN